MNATQNFKYPVVLIIRDGWGENAEPGHTLHNALDQASIAFSRNLSRQWPRSEVVTHGLDVGLPEGIMGNSEVGHQSIGAGRIVDQEILRLNKGLTLESLRANACFNALLEHIKRNRSRLHLVGLVSDGGVHSHIDHLCTLIKTAKEAGVSEILIHAFTDGRDTPPYSGLGFMHQLEAACHSIGAGVVASVSGRFWAMDRDNRWDRTAKAYNCIVGRDVEQTANGAIQAIQAYYDYPLDASRKGDEFILPTQLLKPDGTPIGALQPTDAVLFFNFRGDRPRQLTKALIHPQFDAFDRGPQLPLFFATLTEYEHGLCPNVLFYKPPALPNTLGMYLANQGVPQFRCAETEKYPHVTFFFNDYQEEPFALEDRVLIPSPQTIATYDLVPEMSAFAVAAATVEAILSQKYSFLLVNFANLDMVGHTGSLAATIKAAETVDACIQKILTAVDTIKGRAIITADHGNAEQMWDWDADSTHTRHTLNPVEVIIYGQGCQNLRLAPRGRLADLAPTVLQLMGLPSPPEMTGRSLIVI